MDQPGTLVIFIAWCWSSGWVASHAEQSHNVGAMITLFDEIVERLVWVGLEHGLAKELVNELVRVEIEHIRVETWMIPLFELRDRTQLITGAWLRLELMVIDWFDREAPTHVCRECFVRKTHIICGQ